MNDSTENDGTRRPEQGAQVAGARKQSGKKAKKAKADQRAKRKQKSPTARPSLDPQGRERPAFLLELPDDPDLNRIVAAFERGDYRLVRDESERLAEQTASPSVRRAANELRRRIDPDPLAKYLLFFAIGLFAFLVFWTYFVHAH